MVDLLQWLAGQISKRNYRNYTGGFSSYDNFASEINGVAHGRLAILLSSSTSHRRLNLQTSLQTVAVRQPVRK